MFKSFKVMAIVFCFATLNTQASLQIALPARDFCFGNSLVLIAHDGNGFEQVAGCVSLNDGKTQYSHDEILDHNVTLLSIAQKESAIVPVVNQDQAKLDDDSIIYLWIDVNPSNVVRVLLIKNSFFADNPFDVVEFSAAGYADEDDFEDDCFDNLSNDDLSHFNLTDIQTANSIELSSYEKLMLGFYTLWAVQSLHVKETYKNVKRWMHSYYAK